jgi:hypothetical protein
MIRHSLITHSTSRRAKCEAATPFPTVKMQLDGRVLGSSIPADNQSARPSEHHARWWQLNDPLQQRP